jgi:hypothetical protein
MTKRYNISARVREFRIPPIEDALVLGREATIGCVAIREALGLLMAQPFAHIEIQDDIISDIIVRERLLQRIPKEPLIDFVLTHIKPLMSAGEILHLELGAEIHVEEGLA